MHILELLKQWAYREPCLPDFMDLKPIDFRRYDHLNFTEGHLNMLITLASQTMDALWDNRSDIGWFPTTPDETDPVYQDSMWYDNTFNELMEIRQWNPEAFKKLGGSFTGDWRTDFGRLRGETWKDIIKKLGTIPPIDALYSTSDYERVFNGRIDMVAPWFDNYYNILSHWQNLGQPAPVSEGLAIYELAMNHYNNSAREMGL